MMPISDVARKLAAAISPILQSYLELRKGDILAAAGLILRPAIKLAFPVALRQIPAVTEAGTNALLDKFADMSIGDLASKLVQHAEQTGRKAHPTLIAVRPKP